MTHGDILVGLSSWPTMAPRGQPTTKTVAHQSPAWLWPVLVPAIVTVILAVLGSAFWLLRDDIGKLERHINRIDQAIADMAKPDGSLGRLSDRLRSVESDVASLKVEFKYRPAALRLGLEDPEIKRISLAEQARFDTSMVAGTADEPVAIDLTYKIVAIAKTHVQFLVDGRVGKATIVGFRVNVPIKSGGLVRLPVIGPPGIPRFYIAILDRPSPNEAVIAVGQSSQIKGG